MPDDTDDKYIVFKRDEFLNQTHGLPMALWVNLSLDDAVVIRRQDYFASPALATYAAMIGIAVKLSMDPAVTAQLLRVADYFERQSHLAADEGWKFPDV